jgi:uncharacterized RDD family membrane protein YckC
MVYAGFWRRFVAQAIDWTLISIIMAIVWVPVAMVGMGSLVGQDLIHAAQQKHAATMPPHSELNIIHTVMPLASNLLVAQAATAVHESAPHQLTPNPAAVPVDTNATTSQDESQPQLNTPTDNMDDMDFMGPVIFMIEVVMYLLIFGVGTVYHTWFIGSKWQATPGKRVMNCVVVTRDGKPIDYGHAFGRHIACILSWLPIWPICIGFMLAGWTREKTALHDLIASTRVVRAQASLPVLAVA